MVWLLQVTTPFGLHLFDLSFMGWEAFKSDVLHMETARNLRQYHCILGGIDYIIDYRYVHNLFYSFIQSLIDVHVLL